MIKLKINVSAITKSKLFRGEKGVYLDATLIETPNSQYGDYMIVEDVTKEERLSGVKGPILGNAKIIGQQQRQAPPPAAKKDDKPDSGADGWDEDVPF
jgi:hypothetical protein